VHAAHTQRPHKTLKKAHAKIRTHANNLRLA
jgi:hypothetical protein